MWPCRITPVLPFPPQIHDLSLENSNVSIWIAYTLYVKCSVPNNTLHGQPNITAWKISWYCPPTECSKLCCQSCLSVCPCQVKTKTTLRSSQKRSGNPCNNQKRPRDLHDGQSGQVSSWIHLERRRFRFNINHPYARNPHHPDMFNLDFTVQGLYKGSRIERNFLRFRELTILTLYRSGRPLVVKLRLM